MCNASAKLLAWMDGELSGLEEADVDRHVQSCPECQKRVQAYEELSRLVVTYCNAAVADPKPRHKLSRLAPVLSGGLAAAVLLLLFGPASVRQSPAAAPVAKASPPSVLETVQATPASDPEKDVKEKDVKEKDVKTQNAGRRRALARPASAKPVWAFQPAVQIGIPAESMFPPGAVPEGITFIAEVSMAPDGSVQGLRLRQ